MGFKARARGAPPGLFALSDAWVLMAVHVGCGHGGGDLRAVIAAGDYIDHAIFRYEELAGGLARLLAGKLVDVRGETFCTTAKAQRIWANAGTNSMTRLRQLACEHLGVEHIPGGSPRLPVPDGPPVITTSQFDAAYRAYANRAAGASNDDCYHQRV